jgi:hypothetical protein
MKTKHILYPFLVIFLCIFGSSCSIFAWEPSPITHPFLIGTEECRPPCWEGIIPGETTYEEALDFLRDSEFVSNEGWIEIKHEKPSLHWLRGDGNGAYIDFYENKAVIIEFLDRERFYDLGSMANHFGEPDGYTVGFDQGIYAIKVFYPDIGLVFVAYQEWGDPISQDMPVVRYYFLSPEDPVNFPSIFHNYLKLSRPSIHEKQYIKWEGYGIVPVNE